MNIQILKSYDKYILFGTTVCGRQAVKQLREEGIDAAFFCDNDEKMWSKKIDEVLVISPQDMAEYVKDNNALVIICSSYAKHIIAAQLEEIGVPYVYFAKPIFVEITSFCNQTCTFCPYEYIKRPKSNLDPKIMRDFLYDLASENSDVIYPTIYPHVLGEPLVSRHFFDFMDVCKELGFYVCIVTNWALMKPDIMQRLFTNYPDFDIVFSMQAASKKGFDWRGEKRLTYEQWVDLLFDVMECKFKYAHKGLMQICTLNPEVVNNVLTRSDSELNTFWWYDNLEEYKQWKRDFGGRCAAFAEEMKHKYPKQYDEIKDAENPILYNYNLYKVIKNLDKWVDTEDRCQFEFAPNMHIYGKKFGLWGVEDYYDALLPEDKYFHWEENWHALTERCDRVGDVSLLSNGLLVSCNIDNEADFVFADLNIGEKYTDERTQERIRKLRDNLSLNPLCRRCKSRVLVFEKSEINDPVQPLTHYGIRWHKKRVNDSGEEYKVSYELSNAFVYPRIKAASLEVDIESVQSKKQFTLIKILSFDDDTKLFTERRNYSLQLKPGERKLVNVPYEFEKGKLHRIDFITATERHDGADDGVAVYSACLKSNRQ